MIRSLPRATDSPAADVKADGIHDEVAILRELVLALSERVEILEAHAFIARGPVVERDQR